MTRTVFFDESGFTGRNLRDPDQPYFVYAGVAIEPDEAKHLLDTWVRSNDIPLGANGEVKVTSLMTSTNTRRRDSVAELLSELGPRTSVAIFEKRFCLAAKFFDYVFDPILLPKIGVFHALRFGHFLANLVLVYSNRDQDIPRLLADFSDLVNGRDARFGVGLPADLNLRRPTDCIKAIIARHVDIVRDHVTEAQQLAFGRWLLDLTCSALFGLLMQMEGDDALCVVCDKSKPLAADVTVFDRFVRSTDVHPDIHINDMRLRSLSLVEPITPRKSHLEAGLQLADVVAGSVANVMKYQQDPRSERLAEALDACQTMWVKADRSYVDAREYRTQVNLSLLTRLAERSVRGENLLDDLEEFVESVPFRRIVSA